MPPVGFEPTIAVLERAKTVRALDRAATAIGFLRIWASSDQLRNFKSHNSCGISSSAQQVLASELGLSITDAGRYNLGNNLHVVEIPVTDVKM
jgi:hypothetical protein